jgi:hypothetical protein
MDVFCSYVNFLLGIPMIKSGIINPSLAKVYSTELALSPIGLLQTNILDFLGSDFILRPAIKKDEI